MRGHDPDRNDAPGHSPGRALSSADREIVALLSMSPETPDELTNMLVTEDEQEFIRLAGTVRHGLTVVLERLERLGLVTRSTENAETWWRLTGRGESVAGKLANGEP